MSDVCAGSGLPFLSARPTTYSYIVFVSTGPLTISRIHLCAVYLILHPGNSPFILAYIVLFVTYINSFLCGYVRLPASI